MDESGRTIIDIDPIDHGSDRLRRRAAAGAGAGGGTGAARGAGRGRSAAAAPAAAAAGDAGGYYTFADPEHGDAAWHPKPHGPAVRPSWAVRPACAAAAQAVGGPAYAKVEAAGKAGAKAPSAKGRLGGVAQLVAGSAIAAVGVPMLVLPGPGLLAIGGGVALAARGAKRAFGRR